MMFMICEETLGAQIHFIKNKISHELRDFRILVFESEKISRILSFSQKQVYARIVHSMTATYPKESVNGGVTVKVAPKSTTNVIFPFHGMMVSFLETCVFGITRILGLRELPRGWETSVLLDLGGADIVWSSLI